MTIKATEFTAPLVPSSLIQEYVSLADKNWFKTGGSARYFAQPTTAEQMAQALAFARENNLPLFMLGSGANILISDEGFDGLVINPQLTELSHAHKHAQQIEITAGAGVTLDRLINYCLCNNLIGLEEFSGIPGTVGGAVFINLHYFEFLLSHFLVKATVINKRTGSIETVDNSWFAFGYNTSRLHDREHVLIDATFRLTRVNDTDAAYARGRHDEIARHRAKKYPTAATCGSFFRNFHDHEVEERYEGKKAIWVAYYLDKIGVKGSLKVGNAQVSHQHANMIVNRGAATSDDIIGVARQMQKRVYDEFGIIPEPECQLVGFKEYPLLKKGTDV